MSRKGNTDAMCAKFTRFDLMYSHRPAAQVQATQSRAAGVNTSTLALTQCLQPGMAVINTPKHHVLRRFSQAIPPLPPARSLARVSVPTARSPGDGWQAGEILKNIWRNANFVLKNFTVLCVFHKNNMLRFHNS